MLTYKSLYSLVDNQITKKMKYNTNAPYTSGSQSSRIGIEPYMMPGSGRRDVTANELIEAMQALLDEALPNNIIEGLAVTATNPISHKIQISAGKGTAGGIMYELDADVTISVPFDNESEIFFVTLYKNVIRFDKEEDNKRLKLAKIVIPKPGITNRVKDRRSDGNPWDAYIVNFHKYNLYGINDTLEEDTIDLLRDNISPILADNLIGNIRLSQNMTISNTAGTLLLDSQSVNIKDISGNIIAKFNKNGTFFYDTDGIEIAKFSVDEARIGNIIITTNTIESNNFASGNLGAGFQIRDNGDAEFNNIKARGKISTSVFEKSTVSSVGGNLLVSDSDVLDTDMTALDASILAISGDTTFAVGDLLRIKDGQDDEWFEVTDISSAPTYVVTRDKGSQYDANENPIWKKGTAVINYGTSGEGLIYMTASDTNSPFIDIITHAGAPWDTTTTRMRMGNVNGFLGAVTDLYGIYIGESTKYLKYDPTNGLRIAGHTLLGSLSISTGGYLNSGQSAYNTGIGYWLEYNSGTPRLSLGNSATNYMTWDGTTLTIKGSITITGGNASVTFYQATEPGSSGDPNTPKAGDYWIDTDDDNKLYTYQTGAWVEVTSGGGIQTFRQSSIPTAVTVGDLWIDTDDNKLYRATNAGDDQITPGEWELQNAAIATGWASGSDTTKIDGGKIYTESIVADAISVGAITAEKIDADAVTAEKINVDNLEAVSANTGTLDVDEYINVGSNVIIDGVLELFQVFGDTLTITAGVNDDLDWTENGSTKTCALSASTTYTPTTLAAEVQSKMRAAADANTTCTYNSTTRKITIANSTLTTFTFKWATGANTLTNCGKTLGFKVDADDTGALTYAADYQAALRVEIGELI